MSQIPKHRIFIAIGGCEANALCVTDGFLTARATHNSFDHTAAIEFLRFDLDFPRHLFLLHDTMEFSASSELLISQANPNMLATAASSGSGGGQCNLLLLQKEYLASKIRTITSLKNCTKLQAILSEGILWKECPPERRAFYENESCEVSDRIERYGGSQRLVEFYRAVGIKKFKANWGKDNKNAVVTP